MQQKEDFFIFGINVNELSEESYSTATHLSDDGSPLIGDVVNDDQNIYSSSNEEKIAFLDDLGINTDILGDLS